MLLIFLVAIFFFGFVLSWAPSVSRSRFEEQLLKEHGVRLRQKMRPDGNCFFRAFSYALFNGNEDRHQVVRNMLGSYVRRLSEDEWNRVSPLVVESGGVTRDREGYAAYVENQTMWGGHPEAYLLAQLLADRFLLAQLLAGQAQLPNFQYIVIYSDRGVSPSGVLRVNVWPLAPNPTETREAADRRFQSLLQTERGLILLHRNNNHYDLGEYTGGRAGGRAA